MNKLFSLAFILSLTTPIFTLDTHADDQNIGNCGRPVIIGQKNSDYHPVIFGKSVNTKIYVLRQAYTAGPTNAIEISPGRDRKFGTRDDAERAISGTVATVFEDSAVIEARGVEYLLKPGLDNLLFSNDDIQIAPSHAMAMTKNGDLLAWFDMVTNEIKACDLSIPAGRGSCNGAVNHWAT